MENKEDIIQENAEVVQDDAQNESIDTNENESCEALTETEALTEALTETKEEIIENPNCLFDKKKDEKLKNIMTYSAIPFIIVSIVFSLFNIGKIRYSLSFLFLAIGIGVLAVFSFIRWNNINTTCSCKVCKQMSKSSLQLAIIYTIVALGLLGTFIYFIVVKRV